MNSYALLLLLSVACNLRDSKMLWLTALVGLAVFVPVPPGSFYAFCAVGELAVALLAYALAADASKVIWRISTLLMLFHGCGYLFDGYPIESPYHMLVKIAEHAELVACILLSHPFTGRLKNGAA